MSQDWKECHGPSCKASEPTSAAHHLCCWWPLSRCGPWGTSVQRWGPQSADRAEETYDSSYSCACAIGSLEGQEVISLIHPVSLAHSVSKSPQAHRMLRSALRAELTAPCESAYSTFCVGDSYTSTSLSVQLSHIPGGLAVSWGTGNSHSGYGTVGPPLL